ncbi:MAG TPA: hypothetical protein DCO79_07020 [Spirochaeta sp.]|nr:hypothetical protein [Spirochaeta sp.]
MNKVFLLSNAVIASPGLFIEDGEILIENGKIVSVGEKGSSAVPEGTKEWDLGGRITMPGLVNPHTHLYSELSTGLSPKGPVDDFEAVLKNFWWPLDAVHDEESVYFSAVSGIIDAVKHGVTCVFDHHASMNYVGGSLDTIVKAFSLAGLKSVCCFEASERPGAYPVSRHFEESLGFIDKHRDSSLVKGMLGLHANFTLTKNSLKLVSEMTKGAAVDYPVHVHCGEAEADFEFCKNDGFSGPVDRLNSFGLLGPNSILAHCIHLSDKDRTVLNEIQPFIVSNPESNANNRVGRPDRSRFPAYLIGTDGMSFDMIASLRSQYLLGRGLSEDFSELYSAFIEEPANLLNSFFPTTGKLEAGRDADVAVLDYIPQTPISRENLIGHLIFGAKGGKVFMTIASGRILYNDGRLTFTYETALREQIKEAALKLHRRYHG